MTIPATRHWIVTGATGFIGRELIYRLLTTSSDTLTLLVRADSSHAQAERRVYDILRDFDPAIYKCSHRISVIRADVTLPDLGLAANTCKLLMHRDACFLHLAANTSFMDSIDQVRRVNVEGVKSAIRFASILNERGCLRRFIYVSTAFVHGFVKGKVKINAPLEPMRARNAYEQSKCEAEIYVRSQCAHLPITIFRPSIVVGDSKSGRMSGSSTIYWAARLFLRGHRRFFARPDARLDIVPVDYVAASIQYLADHPNSVGQCLELVAGADKDISLKQLSVAMARHFDLPEPTLVNPDRLLRFGAALSLASSSVGQRLVMEQMRAYLPYFTENPRFDGSTTERSLEGSGITVPAFDDYSDTLLGYCRELGWKRGNKRQKVSA